ncbi:MAG: RNA polymerase sigma factor [Alphaproteobacteria bacterium]|nr:RNA polymerase sigma factor [Alphaproteobacteria bacterium]
MNKKKQSPQHTPEHKSKEEKTDIELVTDTLAFPDAFLHIYERYHTHIAHMVRYRTSVSNAELENIVQDIFIKAYKYLESFDTSLSFSAWLFRIARNECISAHRKKSVRPEGYTLKNSDELISFLSEKDDTAQNALHQELSTTISSILSLVSETHPLYADVLYLYYFEHKNYTDISDTLEISTSAVGTTLTRARKHIRMLLEQTHKYPYTTL